MDEMALVLSARKLGLKAKVVSTPLARLAMATLPALALCDSGDAFIIARVNGDQVLIHDLAEKRPQSIDLAMLQQRYRGRLLQVASRASVLGELARFDFSWFIPAVIKYRKMLLEVFVVSFFIQLFALVTPLFYQVVMDKVLVHRGLTTLDVIAIGLVSITVFDIVLSGLRTYVLRIPPARSTSNWARACSATFSHCRWPTSSRAVWATPLLAYVSWRTFATS